MSEQEKRYAKVGDLVIHKRSGEMGRIVQVHETNSYVIAGRPVSCPVAILDSGSTFLDVPGKTLFDFLPDGAEPAIELLRGMFDAVISDAIDNIVRSHNVDKNTAMAIVGSVIRERLRKEV